MVDFNGSARLALCTAQRQLNDCNGPKIYPETIGRTSVHNRCGVEFEVNGMTKSASIALSLTLSFCCLALNSTSAQTLATRPACGDTNSASGPDFHTFRQLARPAINERAKAHHATQSTAAEASAQSTGVSQASHIEHASSADSVEPVKRASPPASRIPAEIFVDPEVATIRLLSVSKPPVEVPWPSDVMTVRTVRRTAAPSGSENDSAPPTSPRAVTQRPNPHSVARKNQLQSNSLLTRIINTGAEENRNATPGILPNTQTQPICAGSNAPAIPPQAEPFSKDIEQAWDISTRRPWNTTHVSTVYPELRNVAADEPRPKPIKDIAPVPNPRIQQTSASEDVPSRPREQAFWVQSGPFDSVSSKEPKKLKVAPVANDPASEKAPPEVASKTGDKDEAANKDEAVGKDKAATGTWATMPIPGRPSDKAPEAPAKPKMEPRKWAGLFVEEMKGDGRITSNSKLMQISFDAPINDTAMPGDVMLTQAEGPIKGPAEKPTPATRRRSRLRLDFLDDPDETKSDPTQDAIRAILGEEDKDEAFGELRSILEDDEESDLASHREKYAYAYEEIVPKPIVKSPRNYAPTLKDVLADREVDPWVEQAYCAAVWQCAGGKCRTQLEQLNDKLERNKQVLWSDCNDDNARYFNYSSNCNLPWGISPTKPRKKGITACRIVRGGGWCTGACGGHCDVGCKVVCPKPGGSCSCTNDSCSCVGEVADVIDSAASCTGETCTE